MKFKWQGNYWKRASHAFLTETKAGDTSLCGAETLTNNGETSNEPSPSARNACGRCVNKIKKLNGIK